MEMIVFTGRTCLKILSGQCKDHWLQTSLDSVNNYMSPALFANPQPLTPQAASLNPFPLGSGSDPSKLQLHALVTVSTQKQSKPNHPTPDQKENSKFLYISTCIHIPFNQKPYLLISGTGIVILIELLGMFCFVCVHARTRASFQIKSPNSFVFITNFSPPTSISCTTLTADTLCSSFNENMPFYQIKMLTL